jgi:hypothetical protein
MLSVIHFCFSKPYKQSVRRKCNRRSANLNYFKLSCNIEPVWGLLYYMVVVSTADVSGERAASTISVLLDRMEY